MENFSVKKIFNIAYGHRLLKYKGKCENLHGHNGKIEVEIEADSLNEEKMVMDFNELKEKVGKWLDENLDHKTILCEKDPLVNALLKANQKLFIVKENPTAEYLCKTIYEKLKEINIKVKSIKFWETDTSMASYKIK